MRGALAWHGRVLTSPKGFHVFVSVCLLTLLAQQAFLFPGAGGDLTEQLVFAQSLEWGYQFEHPPLFTWLVVLPQQVFGVTYLAVAAVKFTALWLTYLFLYRAARQVLRDARLAALAALSPLAIYHVAVDAVLGRSHSVLAMCLYAATLVVLLRLDRAPGWSSYLLLGATLGVGMLSRHTYPVFAASLLVACLCDDRLRAALLTPRFLVSAAVAGAVVAPHYLWAAAHIGDFLSVIRGKLELGGTNGGGGSAAGLLDLARAVSGFLLPLWVVVLLLFPSILKTSPAETPQPTRYQRVLGVHLLVLIGIFVALILAFDITRIRTQYMFVLILFPIYAFARIERNGFKPLAADLYAGLIGVLAIGVVLGMFVKLHFEPSRCKACPFHVRYAALAETLREAGFTKGTILAHWHPYAVAGNLKVHFPESRVLSVKHPQYAPPRMAGDGQCLVIWPDGPEGWRRTAMISNANTRLGTTVPMVTTADIARVPLFAAPERTADFAYILRAPGEDGCR